MFPLAGLVGWWAIGGPVGAVCSLGSASAGCADGGRGEYLTKPQRKILSRICFKIFLRILLKISLIAGRADGGGGYT